jgi:hypothetical protein
MKHPACILPKASGFVFTLQLETWAFKKINPLFFV